MQHYDPAHAPLPAAWLALDEAQRILLATAFHEEAGILLPNVEVHAIIHCVVETQIAEGLAPAANAVARLRKEGLSRHDAVHAVGSVLAGHLHKLMSSSAEGFAEADNRRYAAELDRLNLKRWHKRYGRR